MTYETKQQLVGWQGVHTYHPLSTKRLTEKKPLLPYCHGFFLCPFFFFLFLAAPSGLWNLTSLTRDQTLPWQ